VNIVRHEFTENVYGFCGEHLYTFAASVIKSVEKFHPSSWLILDMSELAGYIVNLDSASYDEPGGVVSEVGLLGGWASASY